MLEECCRRVPLVCISDTFCEVIALFSYIAVYAVSLLEGSYLFEYAPSLMYMTMSPGGGHKYQGRSASRRFCVWEVRGQDLCFITNCALHNSPAAIKVGVPMCGLSLNGLFSKVMDFTMRQGSRVAQSRWNNRTARRVILVCECWTMFSKLM